MKRSTVNGMMSYIGCTTVGRVELTPVICLLVYLAVWVQFYIQGWAKELICHDIDWKYSAF